MSIVRRITNRCNSIDTHELLKQEIYKQGAGDTDNNYQLGVTADPNSAAASAIQSVAPPSGVTGIADTYLYFDSRAKDQSSNLASGQMKFSVVNLNNQQPIDNLVEMRIASSFYFPIPPYPAGVPSFYFFKRLYMQIASLPTTQSVLAQNGRTFHFEFDMDTSSSIAVKCSPTLDTFYFVQPITTMTDFNLQFTVPDGFTPVPIPNDTIAIAPISNTNPAQFQVLGLDTAFLSIGLVGVPVPTVAAFITGFQAAYGSNLLNSTVETTQGLFIDNVLSSNIFSVSALNFSGVTFVQAVGSMAPSMFLPKNRFAFMMRFSSIKQQNTNYQTGVHL